MERLRTVARRLSCAVPLTPWPVVLWFQTMPDWGGGAHGANALAGISMAILPISIGTNAGGWLLIVVGRSSWSDVAWWSLAALLHAWALFTYIAANVVWYA